MTNAPNRQARFRAEYAQLYPGLKPGMWLEAGDLAEQMLTQHLLRPSPGYMLEWRHPGLPVDWVRGLEQHPPGDKALLEYVWLDEPPV